MRKNAKSWKIYEKQNLDLEDSPCLRRYWLDVLERDQFLPSSNPTGKPIRSLARFAGSRETFPGTDDRRCHHKLHQKFGKNLYVDR